MGLDMYAYKTKEHPSKSVDFKDPPDANNFFYWRKHPNLHGWMEQLYRKKQGEKESFNCAPVVVTEEDLDELETLVREDKLPSTTGFFFGVSRPEDKEDDLLFIEHARAAIKDRYTIYYSSWW